MSTRKVSRFFQRCFRQIVHLPQTFTKRLVLSLLRILLLLSRKTQDAVAGFVLPTVVMVMLVVSLLVTAVMLRSFDRAKNAANFRVNETTLYAAAPAIDRAKAKIAALFDDPTLPRATPSDAALYNAIKSSSRYTFGDETRLKVALDFNGTSGIQTSTTVADDETSTAVWRFPVDTDNNGKFDTFTLYSISFRTPPRTIAGGKQVFARARNALEARSAPMNNPIINPACLKGTGTSSGLVGNSDWYSMNGVLKKSFFVHTVNVPISAADIAAGLGSRYEVLQGTKGFAALEMQQDRALIPLTNNAVWYEDDFIISNSPTINLNGRLHLNSNMLVTGDPTSGVDSTANFFLISNKNSCYYLGENSKIEVGGNVANGGVTNYGALSTTDQGRISVHRFDGTGRNPVGTTSNNPVGTTLTEGINSTNKSTTATGGSTVAYNNNAYDQRIGLLIDGSFALIGTGSTYTYQNKKLDTESNPVTTVSAVSRFQAADQNYIVSSFTEQYNDTNRTLGASEILYNVLNTYFRDRTRRVPLAEVTSGASAVGTYTSANIFTSQTGLFRPPDTWMAIQSPSDGTTTSYTKLTFQAPTSTVKKLALATTSNNDTNRKQGREVRIGDRIITGNNLPKYWAQFKTDGTFDKFAQATDLQDVFDNTNAQVYYDDAPSASNSYKRKRLSQIQSLPDLGGTGRDSFWERAAAKIPPTVGTSAEDYGGLRVITGAGLYYRSGSSYSALNSASYFGSSGRPSLESGVTAPTISSQLAGAAQTVTTSDIVWSDLMPMTVPDDPSTTGTNESTLPPDLRMRSTVVYHATSSTGVDQTPIACVSSYYDPTNSTTAQNNRQGTPWNTTGTALPYSPVGTAGATGARSNNGVAYPAPYSGTRIDALKASGVLSELVGQAKLVFPNGRFVNQPLQKALAKVNASGDLKAGEKFSLADNAAIDAAICSLKILDGSITPSDTVIPHGAIKEAAFLDARQVKSLNAFYNSSAATPAWDNSRIAEVSNLSTSNTQSSGLYSLPLEQRQPLEIRTTDLDLNLLRGKTIGTPTDTTSTASNNQDYLLPNTGLIYASRSDALPDVSAAVDRNNPTAIERLTSASDFLLDPSRRPNGIRLINGSNLSRVSTYRIAEKGLIMVTDLPVYIQAQSSTKAFNLHAKPGTTSLLEEFTETLNTNWSNFYDGATERKTLNTDFACRKNQSGCGSDGDQWRPATIIGDSITLLSSYDSGMTGWWDGYREDGDYNFNNNVGNNAVDKRTKAGFWNNSFVTNKTWASGTAAPYYPTESSSYMTNGVTPVQRRVDTFPEYLMEYCIKPLISQCGNGDWYVGKDGSGNLLTATSQMGQTFSATTHLAGTTAKAPDSTVRNYPRRIAFRRKGKTLFLEAVNNNPTPQPLGLNSSGVITNYSYSSVSTTPRTSGVKQALWYQVTANTSGEPYNDIKYSADRLIAYDINSVQVGAETPEFLPGGSPSLNTPTQLSKYTVCTKTQSSTTKFAVTPSTTFDQPNCPTGGSGGSETQMETFRKALQNLAPDSSNTNNVVRPTYSGDATGTSISGSLGNKTYNYASRTSTNMPSGYTYNSANPYIVNVIDIGGDITTNGGNNQCFNLNLTGDSTSIFVFRYTSNNALKIGPDNSAPNNNNCGLKMTLNGVEPNNVFWSLNGNIQMSAASGVSNYHTIAGTLILESTGNPVLDGVVVDGGRILGGNVNSIGTGTTVYAIAADGQPRPFPMLQIHTPAGSPATNATTTLTADTVFKGLIEGRWLTNANAASNSPATFNLAMVVGDSPSRTFSGSGETNGGFPNFPRILENWAGTGDDYTAVNGTAGSNYKPMKISGSFIESKLSSYSTGPYQPAGTSMTTNAVSGLLYPLNQNGATQTVYSWYNGEFGGNSGDKGFKYAGGGNARQSSFHRPPNRLWGYDVALLTQSPDLFAQRFVTPPAGNPDEYFREVDRNDSWVDTLLCAAAPDSSGGTYNSNFAIRDASQRGSICRGSTAPNYN